MLNGRVLNLCTRRERGSVCACEGVGSMNLRTSGLVLNECLMSSTVSFCRKMDVCTAYTCIGYMIPTTHTM